MTIDRIKISKEVFMGSKWIGLEATIDQMEDPIAKLMQLEEIIKQYCLRSGTSYLNGQTSSADPVLGTSAAHHSANFIPVINRAYEREEIEISRCETIEQLATHKDFATKNPDLMPYYMNKLKELTNKIKV